MSKKTIVTSSIILILVLILLVILYILSPRDNRNHEANKTILHSQIIKSTKLGLENYDFNCEDCDLFVDDYEEFDKWVIAIITNRSEPESSNARHMEYVFEKSNDKLKLIAFSGDGFSENSFPEGTNKKIIEKMISYENN